MGSQAVTRGYDVRKNCRLEVIKLYFDVENSNKPTHCYAYRIALIYRQRYGIEGELHLGLSFLLTADTRTEYSSW